MKNAIIAALATVIFYINICEVHIPATIPVIFGLIWFVLAGIDEAIANHRASKRNGQRLVRQLKSIQRRYGWKE